MSGFVRGSTFADVPARSGLMCARCGGQFFRDLYGDLVCLQCGRPAVQVVPLSVEMHKPKKGRRNDSKSNVISAQLREG